MQVLELEDVVGILAPGITGYVILCLSFLICQMDTIVVTASQGGIKIK